MERLRLREIINPHQGHRAREWPKQDLNPGIFNYENYVLSNNVIHVKLRFHTFMTLRIFQVKLRNGKNITNKNTKPYKKELCLSDTKTQNKAKTIMSVRKLIKTECEA